MRRRRARARAIAGWAVAAGLLAAGISLLAGAGAATDAAVAVLVVAVFGLVQIRDNHAAAKSGEAASQRESGAAHEERRADSGGRDRGGRQ